MIKIAFGIGHIASLKQEIVPNGFTHEWKLYVRGCGSSEISHYVEKVVFYLHPSFQKPKRVFKQPPYIVSESGFGSFDVKIEIHFKAAKKIVEIYDLLLDNYGSIVRSETRTHLFKKPSEEFRRNLINGGGWTINGDKMAGTRQHEDNEKENHPAEGATKKADVNKRQRDSLVESSSELTCKRFKKETQCTEVHQKNITEALELQHKINTLEDDDKLQQVVDVIAETGHYEIENGMFQFDVLTLDEITIQKLQRCFMLNSS